MRRLVFIFSDTQSANKENIVAAEKRIEREKNNFDSSKRNYEITSKKLPKWMSNPTL